MIELRHLQKKYQNTTPLIDVNARINKGDVISMIGPSGCGKTTLLRCINMLDPPTAGSIFVEGEEITVKGYDLNKLRLKVGMIFQSFNLFSHQTVIENIMKPQMRLLGRSKQDAYDKAYQLLTTVGLADKQLQFPDQLSGGQQQRVAIARALAMDPEILLLDEPTSALDPTMVGEVETVIAGLARNGTTMMIVTHDMNLARSVSNRVFYLDEGIIYEDGTPKQIFFNPQKEKTRRFIRSKYSLNIRFAQGSFDYPKAISDIIRFGGRQGLDSGMINKLQMAFEELCAIYFSDNYQQQLVGDVLIEYHEHENKVTMDVSHNAGVIPKCRLKSNLSLVLILGIVSEFEQTELDESKAPYNSLISLTFRKGDYDARKE